MLLANGKELKIHPESKGINEKFVLKSFAELRERFNMDKGGKAAFVYPEERIKTNTRAIYLTDKPYKRVFKPKSLNITLVTSVVDENDNRIEWRYCESKHVRSRGGLSVDIFDPDSKLFDGAMALGSDQMEFLFYIIYCFNGCIGGKNENMSIPNKQKILKLVDRDKDEAVKADAGTKHARVSIRIYGSSKEGGLTDEKLRTIGGGLFIPNAATMEIKALKNQLSALVTRDDAAYAQFFAASTDRKDVATEMKAIINAAVDTGFLKYNDKKNIWLQRNAGGKNTIVVVKVSGAGDPKEALFKHLVNDQELMAVIERAIEPEDTE